MRSDATRAMFADVLEQHADGARLAARFAHVYVIEAQASGELSDEQRLYWLAQRETHDAIADRFDELAFDLTHGGSHAR